MFEGLHDHPVALTVACYAVAALVVYLTDPFAMPRSERDRSRIERTPSRIALELAARLPIILFVFSIFFAISWRPLYGAVGTISFFVIFTGISRAKFIFIREPLVFSDIALVMDVFKYKTIFYATRLNILFWVVALGYVFGASAAFMIFEPDVLPDRFGFFWVLVGLSVPVLPIILLFVRPVGQAASWISEKLLRTLKVKVNTVRFGTFTSVAYHFMIWLGMRRDAIVAELTHGLQNVIHELIGAEEGAAPLIVIWQSESFLDLRNVGDTELELPTIDRLRDCAAQWGRLTSVFEGGYTLRTEFSVLSGLQPDDVHADASYPYLRAAHYSDVVWPTKLRKAGWLTHFIHPYESTFFHRNKAMPLLGFSEMTMLDAFDHKPERDGPYVSDQRLTDKVVGIVGALDDTQPALLFVASMANHGPWEPGRCEGMTDPVEIYRELLRRADAALGALVEELDKLERPVWLTFYGDHAPLLKRFADPFPDPRTDYFIVPLGGARQEAHKPTRARVEAPWNLFETLLWHSHLYKEQFR